ncbi:hypothetical protein [uncultured Hoeflea sp.]|uniref:hypothetical protein n=1 Tax=uncultured Hoeflea sp. TaxID=538666 RepID=UPI0026311542|nr:hypothetical protein [uncultured Hoeflea sp.]
MARTLITPLVTLALAGCGTAIKKLDQAAETTGEARARIERPVTPPSCIAKMERVKPKVDEKARWTQKRWEIVADNRDQLAADCGAALDAYWDEITKVGPQ